MKRLFIILSLFLLSACAASQTSTLAIPVAERLRNPLFAERYFSEQAEHMADFLREGTVYSHEQVEDAIVDAARLRAMERVAYARERKQEGIFGNFPKENTEAVGEMLLLKNVLYVGTDFVTLPSPGMRIYLTTTVDPSDSEFPDATALDLGDLQSPYGAQEYVFPEERVDPRFRTAVLWDTRLKRLYGFVQLNK